MTDAPNPPQAPRPEREFDYPALFRAEIRVNQIEHFISKYTENRGVFWWGSDEPWVNPFSIADFDDPNTRHFKEYGSPEVMLFEERSTSFGSDFEALLTDSSDDPQKRVTKAGASFLSRVLISELLDHSTSSIISPTLLPADAERPNPILSGIEWDVDYIVVSSLKIPIIHGYISPSRLKQFLAALGIGYAAIANYPGFKAGCVEIASDLNAFAQQTAKTLMQVMDGDISTPEVTVASTALIDNTGSDEEDPTYRYYIDAINNPRRWISSD